MRIDIWTISPVVLVVLGAILIVQRRRGRSLTYLCCLALFGVYLAAVAHWTIFPLEFGIEPAALLAIAEGRTLSDAIQIVPLHDGLAPTRFELVGNILLGVPFGFGLPFVSQRRGWEVLLDGLYFAAGLELVQLAIDIAYGVGLRVVDVNDVILVWLGVAAGYLAFRVLAEAYRTITRDASVPTASGHLHEVLSR